VKNGPPRRPAATVRQGWGSTPHRSGTRAGRCRPLTQLLTNGYGGSLTEARRNRPSNP
jgi:hypothetical protein